MYNPRGMLEKRFSHHQGKNDSDFTFPSSVYFPSCVENVWKAGSGQREARTGPSSSSWNLPSRLCSTSQVVTLSLHVPWALTHLPPDNLDLGSRIFRESTCWCGGDRCRFQSRNANKDTVPFNAALCMEPNCSRSHPSKVKPWSLSIALSMARGQQVRHACHFMGILTPRSVILQKTHKNTNDLH